MHEVACVVFDLDDTLYLERDYVRTGFLAVGTWANRELGIPDFAPRAWRAFEAGERGTIFDQVLAECNRVADAQLLETLVDVYRRHEPGIALLPDARAALKALPGRDLRVAVLTDGPLESQRAKAHALGADRFASATVYTAALGPGFGKPSPRGFGVIERELACSGRQCVYVADNPAKDFAGPRALGWHTMRIRRPGSLHERVDSGSDVDVEVRDLNDFDTRLGGC